MTANGKADTCRRDRGSKSFVGGTVVNAKCTCVFGGGEEGGRKRAVGYLVSAFKHVRQK